MLQVNPKMLPRLAEIEKYLLPRRERAQEEHWLGEVEGIDSTLTFLRAKQAEAARLVKRPVTDLGIPRRRPIQRELDLGLSQGFIANVSAHAPKGVHLP